MSFSRSKFIPNRSHPQTSRAKRKVLCKFIRLMGLVGADATAGAVRCSAWLGVGFGKKSYPYPLHFEIRSQAKACSSEVNTSQTKPMFVATVTNNLRLLFSLQRRS